jgi:hypothetical protein
MIKIMTVERLLRSIDTIHLRSNPMEEQLQRTRDRLRSGIDVDGRTFAKYKNDNPKNHSRPLEKAVHLYDHAKVMSGPDIGGAEFSLGISGRAAVIATYQNVRRTFSGFSDEDRSLVRENLFKNLREGM